MYSKISFLLVTFLFLLTACAPAATPTGVVTPEEGDAGTGATPVIRVFTHDSFDVSEEVVNEFQNANNVEVQFLAGGDTGSALNRLILAKDNPPADVFYGVDNTFLGRALAEDIFQPYESPMLAEIPDQFELDPQFRALPVDYGDVCLNYDIQYFTENNLELPASLEDLTLPAYRGLLVVQNPATSSPGLAFLLATIANFGDPGYLDYWADLAANEVKVVSDWETAYYTEFTRWGGAYPLVVSYGSSPPAEVIFAEEPIDAPPTGAIVAEGTCFRQIEFVGILRGAQNVELAQKWVDFMLSTTFQEDMPLKMFVFPVNENARLDETFEKFLAIPDQPAQLDLGLINENRERWIQEWTETVLR
jgi:thiamine transport system substrate-binding protein